MGDITGDLSSKRGQVNGTHNGAAATMVVRGQVPMSELSGYQSRLNAMTSGQGRYTHRRCRTTRRCRRRCSSSWSPRTRCTTRS